MIPCSAIAVLAFSESRLSRVPSVLSAICVSRCSSRRNGDARHSSISDRFGADGTGLSVVSSPLSSLFWRLSSPSSMNRDNWRGIVLIFLVQEIALPREGHCAVIDDDALPDTLRFGMDDFNRSASPDLAVDQPVPLREIEKPFSPFFNLIVKSRNRHVQQHLVFCVSLPNHIGAYGPRFRLPRESNEQASKTRPFYLLRLVSATNVERKGIGPIFSAP